MIITKAIVRSSRAAAVAAIALLAGAVSPAMAATPDPDAAAPAPAAKAQDQQPKKARQFCIDSELTGSRIRHMVCKTRDQWIKDEGIDPMNLQAR